MKSVYTILATAVLAVAFNQSALAAPYQMTQQEAEQGQRGVEAYNAGDYQRALRLWKPLADKGVSIAEHNYGRAYAEGTGVKRNYKQAAYWYQRAAEHGHTPAVHNLGMLYLKGLGVKKDAQKAAQLLQQSAQQGDDLSQYQLGMMYYTGEGVRQDKQRGFALMMQSAEQGNKNAMKAVASAYAYGAGVAQDSEKARAWYDKIGNDAEIKQDEVMYQQLLRLDEAAKRSRQR
jgi:hypothetical protein